MSDSDRRSSEDNAREIVQRSADPTIENLPKDLEQASEISDQDDPEATVSELSKIFIGETGSSPTVTPSTVSEEDVILDSTLDLSSGVLIRRPGRSDAARSESEMTSDLGRPAAGGLLAAPTYRPIQRPPVAVIRVYDDDQEQAELVRVRRTPFDIGRQEGDLTVPNELQMSRRHARIDRRQVTGEWQWFLRDLGSTNGTFVRAKRVRLRDKDEVLLGADLVRFLQPGGPETAVLLKVAPGRHEEKVALRPGTHWIGTNAAECLPLLQGNKFLDPKSLRLELDGQGQWRLFDCDSTNHVWVRIEEVRLVDGCCFQAGEQRFGFHLP